MTTYEEWRVTGIWGYEEPYEFTWSPVRNGYADPGAAARNFVAKMREHNIEWTDGPYLHKRTVTLSEWTEVDA